MSRVMDMIVDEVMNKLEELGTEQTKRTFMRHGAKEPLFGVKVGDLKKLVKDVRKDQVLAMDVFDTGNSDAMYLAGLAVNPETMTKEKLQAWARQANWYLLSEYTVAGVTAESPFALELAREWMKSGEELIATCGWRTYANYISMTEDEKLDLEEIRGLLHLIEETIHEERNRVRYSMNSFVIIVGSSVHDLYEEALQTAEKIGRVYVHVGEIACKLPEANGYIKKAAATGTMGVKKKTCIC
jgi:3-methyladenine DNA glycosylase AlkD